MAKKREEPAAIYRATALREMRKLYDELRKEGKKEKVTSKQKEEKARKFRYSEILEEDLELKKLYEKFVNEPIDLREELALFRAVFVKAVRDQREEFPLEKYLVCLEKLAQMIERSTKVDKVQDEHLEKLANELIMAINSALTCCPYCNMSLSSIKENLAKQITNIERKYH